MRIGILGGGVTGLTVAEKLSSKHEVVVIEASPQVGGLAQGFKMAGWRWYLDNTYHHIFSNDTGILHLAKAIGTRFSFSKPKTKTIFGSNNNYRIFPVDNPQDILLLPELSLLSRLRTGAVAAFFKLTPFLPLYEQSEAGAFLRQTMGEEAWNTMWGPIFRKKFGKYAEKIVTSFIWARINKRTRALGYPEGGFQSFVNDLTQYNSSRGVVVKTGTKVLHINKNGESFLVTTEDQKGEVATTEFDRIVSTLPYPIFLKVAQPVLPQAYIESQSRRKYLWAVNLIVETESKILPDTYWLNVNAADIPIMCVVQHTNFVNKDKYGNKEIAYFAWYVDREDELLQMKQEEILQKILPSIRLLSSRVQYEKDIRILKCAKVPFAQPIFDREFTLLDRSMVTPVPGLFNANLDLTYPFDRGTNYAVELGIKVSNLLT